MWSSRGRVEAIPRPTPEAWRQPGFASPLTSGRGCPADRILREGWGFTVVVDCKNKNDPEVCRYRCAAILSILKHFYENSTVSG
jgi:hypothetical protein